MNASKSDPQYKSLAETVARSTPDHNGRSFFPPRAWHINAYGNLVVIGDDGRKVVISVHAVETPIPSSQPRQKSEAGKRGAGKGDTRKETPSD